MTLNQIEFEDKIIRNSLRTLSLFAFIALTAWLLPSFINSRSLAEKQSSSMVMLYGNFMRGTGTIIDSFIVTSYEAVGDYKTVNVIFNNLFNTTTQARLVYSDEKTGLRIFKPNSIMILKGDRLSLKDLEKAPELFTNYSLVEKFKGTVGGYATFDSFEAMCVSKTKKNDLDLSIELYRIIFDYQVTPSCNVGGVIFSETGTAGLLVSNFQESAFMIPGKEIVRVLKTQTKN